MSHQTIPPYDTTAAFAEEYPRLAQQKEDGFVCWDPDPARGYIREHGGAHVCIGETPTKAEAWLAARLSSYGW